ncbi:MAG TPA: hypothetical protein VGS21_10690 [Acidimicrobiales bacterium]|nr:hypothetical protein [Acidimicrobiales bacterium]
MAEDETASPPPSSRRGHATVAKLGWPALVLVVIVAVNLPGLAGLVDLNPVHTLSFLYVRVGHGYLPGGYTLDSNIGYTAQALGHRAALDWLSFHVPWWNPFEGIGTPLAAEMQSAAFFPPVLLMALPDGSLYFHITLEAIAGLSTYFLVRELQLSRPVAMVGGVMFGLCGTFDWLWHAPMNPVPLLPLTLLGVERMYRNPSRASGPAILAIGLALSFYAGFPETAYFDGLLVAGYALARVLARPKGERAFAALVYCAAGFAGLLLALPLALPFADYLSHSYTGVHSLGVGYQYLSSGNLTMAGFPYLYGPLEAMPGTGNVWTSMGGFVTGSEILLGAVGVVAARRDLGLRLLLVIATVVVGGWTFGIWPLSKLTTVLPYMSHIAISRYSEPVWEMTIVLLACYGLTAIREGGRPVRYGVGAGVAGLGVLGIVMASSAPGRMVTNGLRLDAHLRVYTAATIAAVAAFAVVAVATSFLPWRRVAVAILAVLAVLDAGVAALLPPLSAPRTATMDLGPVDYLSAHAGLGRFLGLYVYHGDYGSYFGTGSVDTSDLPVPSAWAAEIQGRLSSNSNPVRFDGVSKEYLAGPSVIQEDVRAIPELESLDVEYFVANDIRPAFGRGPAYPGGITKVFDDGHYSVFRLPDPLPYFHVSGGGCVLDPSGYDDVRADCSAPATLVRAELYEPGWSATVNGRAVQVTPAGGPSGNLYTTIALPAGSSTVQFTYLPPDTYVSLAGVAVGGGILVALPVVVSRRRRRLGVRGEGVATGDGGVPGDAGDVEVPAAPAPEDERDDGRTDQDHDAEAEETEAQARVGRVIGEVDDAGAGPQTDALQ